MGYKNCNAQAFPSVMFVILFINTRGNIRIFVYICCRNIPENARTFIFGAQALPNTVSHTQ